MLSATVLSRVSAIAFAMLLTTATYGQKPGGGGGGTPGGTPGGGGGGGAGAGAGTPTRPNPTIPTPGTPGTTTPQRSPFPDMGQRPIFLSGKVLLSDGVPPPEPVVIERICSGYSRPEGYTDSKGRFSIQLGANTYAAMADASQSSYDPLNRSGSMGVPGRGVNMKELQNCELRAVLPGFRSDTVSLFNRRALDNPDVGTIVLHRMGNVEGLTISATSAEAPKDAKKAYEKGREALQKGKLADAQKQLAKAVELYPRYATAWYELGRVHMAEKNATEARADFQHALDADSKYVSPYESLAQMAAMENKWQDVVDITDRVLRMNPYDFPQSYFFSAIANLNLHNLDAAEKSANEFLKSDAGKRNAKIYHVLGLIQAQKEQYTEAAASLRKYIETAPPDAPGLDQARKQLAEIEKLAAANPPAGTDQKP